MYEKELQEMISAARLAAEQIMKIYNTDFDVEIKSDNSPVTLADKNADQIIRSNLQKAFPKYAFLTEESTDDLARLENDYVFIVDPVDGTKDFVDRNGEFTINIALSYKHEVVVGVVMIPYTKEIYYGVKNQGSFYSYQSHLEQIHVNDKTEDLVLLTSRFHCTDEELKIIENHKDKIQKVSAYGSSIKACRIAKGLAEISLRLSPNTKEWDTAACQIIVEEAGGIFVKPNGERILYNREDVYNREGYVIANCSENNFLNK